MSIPMMAEREEALRLWEAKKAAEKAYSDALDAACEAKPDIVDKYAGLESALDEQEFDDHDTADAAYDALHEKRDAEFGVSSLAAALKAAEEAFEAGEHELIASWQDGGIAPARCAKTNVPLLWSDETVSDDQTDEIWLRSAIGLPPRPVKVEEEEIEEAA
jgi:hypothetical protein